MFVRQEILPEENLPSAQEVCELGQSLARDWSIGNCEFFRAHACSSEAQYKLRCMEQGRIMQHAHMGFRNADKSFNAYSEIYERCLSHGVEIDRYGICLDWSMGYPAAQRESQLKGTGLILRDAEAFVELTSRAPVASHFGDFMLGFPGALENTCHALAAGVTSIGNLGQYFTFQLPGWRDDVETTRSTLGAIALMAAQPETVLIHSNLDDGFAAVFEDLSSAVGAAMLERYLVEDLMGGHIAHCYGHHYSTPELRFAFHHALADVSSTPGSMVYGNTTSYRGTAAENFASLAGYLSVDIAAQRTRPTGHAINPVPVTENERIPDIDEIVDAQLFAARMVEVTENHFQFNGDDVSLLSARLIEGGRVFFDNVLQGFADAGIDIRNPVEMFLAIRRIGGKKLETWYGPGEKSPQSQHRNPLVASDTVRELDAATEHTLGELEHHGLEKLANNRLRIVVATTDVHEHSKMLLERLFVRMGIGVIDGGVSVDPRDLAQIAERTDAHAIALSTYNGVALTYYGMLRDELTEMGIDIPVLVGGQLNEIPQDSEDSLPVDVGDELDQLGAVVCRTIPDAMPWLIELTETHQSSRATV